MGQRWNVILDIVPASGERLLMQTAPGFIHSGTDFDVNGAGIVISETTIGNFAGFDVDGLPEFMRARNEVIDSTLAGQLSFWARMGHPDGSPFDWGPFFVQYPQCAWQAPYLRNLVTNQWTQFTGKGPLTAGLSAKHPATAARRGPPRVSGYTIDRMTSKGAESIVHYVRH